MCLCSHLHDHRTLTFVQLPLKDLLVDQASHKQPVDVTGSLLAISPDPGHCLLVLHVLAHAQVSLCKKRSQNG